MTESAITPAPGDDERLRAILHDVLWDELAGDGIRAHEEVCVREVALRLAAGSDTGEPAAVESAARAWASKIREDLRRGDTANVVHYRDRRAAAVDMARSILAENWERSWAWVQLGFWTPGTRESARNGWRQWCRAIIAEPRETIPILRAAAVDGVLVDAALRLDRPEWNSLIGALVRHHGAMDFAGRTAFGETIARGAEDGGLAAHAARLHASSPLAETFDELARRVQASAELARFWATLVLFDTEASLAYAKPERAARVVQALAERFVDDEPALSEDTRISAAPVVAEGRLVDRVLDSPPEPPFGADEVSPLLATVESILSDAKKTSTNSRPAHRSGDTGMYPNYRSVETAGD